ncbi:MAG: hypothetical protein LAT78_13660 [Roseinatronobacter sp.]|nr:hypothetical protein [Roseinatronobacter sp.]
MAKLALAVAFVVSLVPATCARKAPDAGHGFETISAPIYVEPVSVKGRR